jgi:hypothetical protein
MMRKDLFAKKYAGEDAYKTAIEFQMLNGIRRVSIAGC